MTIRTLPTDTARRVRRLLLLPAMLLVLLGTPVLATEDTAPAVPTSTDVAVAPASEPLATGWTSEETPVDATLVGVRWNGDPEAEFTVEAKTTDGDWEAADALGKDETGADEGSADAVRAAAQPGPENNTEPVWVGTDVTAVRVTLDEGTAADVTIAAVDSQPATTPDGSAGAFGLTIPVDGPQRYLFGAVIFGVALLLAAVALGWSPWRRVRGRRHLAALMVVGALALAGCVPVGGGGGGGLGGYADPPPAMPRSQWGGDLPFVCPGGPQQMSHIGFAVVHHTAGSNSYGPNDAPAIMRGIWQYHVGTLGYCDVAYNFFIDKYGQIYEGRWGGTSNAILGGHSGGFNSYSTGIALIGNYSGVSLPNASYNALVHLLRWKLSIHKVNPAAGFATIVADSPCACMRWPAGTAVGFPSAIVGHGDLDFTSCPGSGVNNRMGQLRADVQAGIVFPPDPTTTTAPPTSTTSTSTTTTSTTTTTTTTSST